MKTIALLANGPSLKDLWMPELREERGYDLVVGVNTAAWIFDIDIWCVLDPAVVNQGIADHFKNGRPLPKVMATRPNAKWLPEQCQHLEMPWYNKDSSHLPEGLCRELGIKTCNFTFPNALYVASVLSEGGRVDIYGMDITPETDVCAKWGDRTAGRWKRELPWTAAAWQPHWRIYGRASQTIRDYLYGKIPFTQVVKYINKYVGGQSTRAGPVPPRKKKEIVIDANHPRAKPNPKNHRGRPEKAGAAPKGNPATPRAVQPNTPQSDLERLGIQTHPKNRNS